MADDEELTKEEKKRRKAEKKERKKEKKAAKKRKRESLEEPAVPQSIEAAAAAAAAAQPAHPQPPASNKSARSRANSTASTTHYSVTEDTITERMSANVPNRIISNATRVTSVASSRNGDDQLPYQLKKIRTLVSLAPSSLSDIKGNIRRLSCEDITRYVKGLGGVLMAVRDVKVIGQGRVLNELPHIHFDVEADVVVFCPEVGMRLIGVVNESFPSHVGMIVDTIFNAMVPSDELREIGYDYDHDTNQWTTERDAKTGELLPSPLPIRADDRIGFTVTKMHEANGIISLDGAEPDMQP